MAKMKVQDCRRCENFYYEHPENTARRNFLKAAVICPECEKEWEKFKEEKGLPKIQYIGRMEPFMF